MLHDTFYSVNKNSTKIDKPVLFSTTGKNKFCWVWMKVEKWNNKLKEENCGNRIPECRSLCRFWTYMVYGVKWNHLFFFRNDLQQYVILRVSKIWSIKTLDIYSMYRSVWPYNNDYDCKMLLLLTSSGIFIYIELNSVSCLRTHTRRQIGNRLHKRHPGRVEKLCSYDDSKLRKFEFCNII